MTGRRHGGASGSKHRGKLRFDKEATAKRGHTRSDVVPVSCEHPRAAQPQQTTIFTGPVYATHVSTGAHHVTSVDTEQLERLLVQILGCLREEGLRPAAEDAIRDAANRTLSETRQPSPRPSRLRRGIAEVTEALLAGAASGASSNALQSLAVMLQHIG